MPAGGWSALLVPAQRWLAAALCCTRPAEPAAVLLCSVQRRSLRRLPAAEPAVKPGAEPEAEPASEPEAEPGAEPEPATESEPGAEPSARLTAEPAARLTAEPVVGPAGEAEAEPTTEPGASLLDEPVAELSDLPADEPTGRHTTEPAVRKADEASVEPAANLAGQPAAKPSAKQSSEPTGEPSSTLSSRGGTAVPVINNNLETVKVRSLCVEEKCETYLLSAEMNDLVCSKRTGASDDQESDVTESGDGGRRENGKGKPSDTASEHKRGSCFHSGMNGAVISENISVSFLLPCGLVRSPWLNGWQGREACLEASADEAGGSGIVANSGHIRLVETDGKCDTLGNVLLRNHCPVTLTGIVNATVGARFFMTCIADAFSSPSMTFSRQLSGESMTMWIIIRILYCLHQFPTCAAAACSLKAG